jgi:hypothetical protein
VPMTDDPNLVADLLLHGSDEAPQVETAAG